MRFFLKKNYDKLLFHKGRETSCKLILKLKRSDTFEDNSHNDFKTYKINTYNSLLKLLKRKIELSQENFISTINKVNVDALINNMQYMQ